MFKVIDRTLSLEMPSLKPSGEQLLKFAEGLVRLGIDWIETSPFVWQAMYRANSDVAESLPVILRLENPKQAAEYAACRRFVSTRVDYAASVQIEHHVSDIRELSILARQLAGEDIRISGLGELIQHDYRTILALLKQSFGSAVVFCPDDRHNAATAMAIEWLLGGGKWIATSFTGRGQLAATESVLMGMRVIGRQRVNADWTMLPELRTDFEEIFKTHVPGQAPVIGRNIFDVEAGIHADGIAKASHIYEPYQPGSVGHCRRLVVGKHSGLRAIQLKLAELQMSVPSLNLPGLLDRVQHESVRLQRSLTDDEFAILVQNFY